MDVLTSCRFSYSITGLYYSLWNIKLPLVWVLGAFRTRNQEQHIYCAQRFSREWQTHTSWKGSLHQRQQRQQQHQHTSEGIDLHCVVRARYGDVAMLLLLLRRGNTPTCTNIYKHAHAHTHYIIWEMRFCVAALEVAAAEVENCKRINEAAAVKTRKFYEATKYLWGCERIQTAQWCRWHWILVIVKWCCWWFVMFVDVIVVSPLESIARFRVTSNNNNKNDTIMV